MGTRRRFTDEFKREAIRLAGSPGVTMSSVARDLDINVSVLRRWGEQHNGGQWQMERDILKKALGYFAKDPT